MQATPTSPDPTAAGSFLLDLSKVDLSRRVHDKAWIERYIPHRGVMSLLDAVVWEKPDYTEAVAIKHVRDDEFWVAGHFPFKPMLPGVLMVEAAAQLGAYLYITRERDVQIAAFLRIENCTFRTMVVPGQDLYLLAREVKFSRRRFISDVQGVVDGKIAFDAQVSGMRLDASGKVTG